MYPQFFWGGNTLDRACVLIRLCHLAIGRRLGHGLMVLGPS
ncbi:hypothetical protein MMUC44124_17470 [Mycolicibacterium mucogenicum DSM 44124]|nr:hypothetical protein MMUC44124_17470 [Mycolicibacterium mucogenicum DSM 44124]